MNSQTIEKMKEMKLYGMARAMTSDMEVGLKDITLDEFVAHLVDAEWDGTKSYYSHTGKPSIDPVVLVKMLLVGYLFDIMASLPEVGKVVGGSSARVER